MSDLLVIRDIDLASANASPPDREKLVAMIDFGNEQWAEINQESDRLQIELYPRCDGKPWKFSLDDALRVIDMAKSRLLDRSK